MKNKVNVSIFDKLMILLSILLFVGIGAKLNYSSLAKTDKYKYGAYTTNTRDDVYENSCVQETFFWKIRQSHSISRAIQTETIVFSGNKKYFASIDFKRIRIWSIDNFKVLANTLKIDNTKWTKAAFNGIGNILVIPEKDSNLVIWDWQKDTIIKKIKVKLLDFSINSQDVLTFVDSQNRLAFYDLHLQSVVKIYKEFSGIAVSHPDKNVIAIYDSNFIFLDSDKNEVSHLDIPISKYRDVKTYQFTPDGQYIAIAFTNYTLELWDWMNKRMLNKTGFNNNVILFNKNNELIISSQDSRSIAFYNYKTGILKKVLGSGKPREEIKTIQKKLNAALVIVFYLLILMGFISLIVKTEHKVASRILSCALILWSFGVGILVFIDKQLMYKYAMIMIWISTIISLLLAITLYLFWLTVFTLPYAFLFCQIKIARKDGKKGVYIPFVLCLILSSLLCWGIAMEIMY